MKKITVTPGTAFERYPGKTENYMKFDIQESDKGGGFQELEGCIAALENGEVIKAIILNTPIRKNVAARKIPRFWADL